MKTDIMFSQDLQQLEPKGHMSWLPQNKLTTEEKEVLQEYTQKKTALLGKYNTHIKDLDTTHETWIGNFSAQHKKNYKSVKSFMQLNSKRYIVSLTKSFVATAGTNIRNTAFRIVHPDLLYISQKVYQQ